MHVTGVCWHDRESMRKARAYGLERIFNKSTLATDATKVKLLDQTPPWFTRHHPVRPDAAGTTCRAAGSWRRAARRAPERSSRSGPRPRQPASRVSRPLRAREFQNRRFTGFITGRSPDEGTPSTAWHSTRRDTARSPTPPDRPQERHTVSYGHDRLYSPPPFRPRPPP